MNIEPKRINPLAHVGGHKNVTHVDNGALLYCIKQLNIKSMLDIGCGPGGMYQLAKKHKIKWVGIDGDPQVYKNNRHILIHNYCRAPLYLKEKFDLAWSIEFLEHVPEEFIKNFIPSFQICKYVLCTAYIKIPGIEYKFNRWHHNDDQPIEYWIKLFEDNGFEYKEDILLQIKKQSTMRKKFIERHGMFFINKNFSA